MQNYKILWADDEIELLKPHILFLNGKGIDVTPVVSGRDALDAIDNEPFDIVFLDENMPGMGGLETLNYIKSTHPNVPVVMITKNEEEQIMEEAIGAKIADYLIKPIHPSQILMSVKKILDNKRIQSEYVNQNYQQDFRNIMLAYSDSMTHSAWVELYKKLVYWELEIEKTQDQSMAEVFESQKSEANVYFRKYIFEFYTKWLNDPKIDKPLLSHQVMKKWVFPALTSEYSLFFIVIDNLRFDQWEHMEPIIAEYYRIVEKNAYFSILPTTTAYARNSLFSGLLPDDIAKQFKDYWVYDDEDEGKNMYEDQLLAAQLQRNGLKDIRYSYHKIIQNSEGKTLVDQSHNLLRNHLNSLVFNFVDMLSHARTDIKMIRELAADEAAYRSLSQSWFIHSPLFDLLKKLSSNKVKVIITTDHGTIRVKRPFKVLGDKQTNTNLRFKIGKNLNYADEPEVLVCKKPEEFHLPKSTLSSSYIFASEDYFFAYPNNYNHFVSHYKDTFQHGGVSMEEVIVPFIVLEPK